MHALYESDDLRVSLREGEGNDAIVVFTGIGLGIVGIQHEEFSKSLRRIAPGATILFVIDRQKSWFNHCSREVADLLNRYIRDKEISSVITLGNSMGGFGAVVYAGLLDNCRRAVAFAPQYSVSRDVVPFERRYDEYVDRIEQWHFREAGGHGSHGVEYLLVFGQKHVSDRKHSLKYLRWLNGDARIIVVEKSGHNVAEQLKKRERLEPVLHQACCVDGPVGAIDSTGVFGAGTKSFTLRRGRFVTNYFAVVHAWCDLNLYRVRQRIRSRV